MKVFHSLTTFSSTKKTIVTLGTFDGVHNGHKKILEKLTQSTNNQKFESLVLTFFPHPRMVLQNNSDLKLLNSIDEKIELFEQLDIDNLVIHPFDAAFSELTAKEFVKNILVDILNVQKVIIGYDHRFGKNRTATIDDLITFGKQFNFEVEQISVHEVDAISVSSTKIRKALAAGNMDLATAYLGYNYTLSGIVIKGNQLGRTINFPTANIKIKEDYKLIPKNGVYIVQSVLDNVLYFGIMNIGYKPTIGSEQLAIEIHFFDFDTTIYNKKIQVALLHRIREEQKFESLEALKTQISLDKKAAINFLKL